MKKCKLILIIMISMFVLTGASAWAADLILNEYNAVSGSNYLTYPGTDSTLGRIVGNGGDWIELVVITDHLDIRGWDLVLRDGAGTETLTFTNHTLWSDLRSGTIITVSEDQTEDVSYDPYTDDWWINVRANSGGSGTYIEQQNFPVDNSDWYITIRDDSDTTIFGPAGEGSAQYPGGGVNDEEVCYLISDPSSSITPASSYDDNNYSSFGAPNTGQDFTTLRDVLDNPLEIAFASSAYTDPAYNVSGVISNPTDPAANYGINFTIGHETVSASSLTVTATSSNTDVVPADEDNDTYMIITGTGTERNLKVIPTGVGYTTITITVSYGGDELSINFVFAASAASNTTTSRYHTGFSDASTAVALDSDYMFVANDEMIGNNLAPIYLYDRDQSGLPISVFDFTSNLGSTDGREVDIEASVRIGSRIFWLASHGNNKDGDCRPTRERLFATDISGTGTSATLTYVGRYDGLRDDLIDWDNNNDHGKGAEYYGLEDSTYCEDGDNVGIEPKRADGFNIEGLVMSPDGDDAYICFRAPISPATARTKALIVPIEDFATWFNNGSPSGSPTFGSPIELDLGGRGIRSIDKNDADEYLIVAGSYGTTGAAPHDFRLFLWTGSPTSAPVLLASDLSDLISEGGSIESIVEMPESLLGGSVQFLLDNGTSNWYGDVAGTESKTLAVTYQKFRSDWITIPEKIRLYVSPSGNNTDGLSWTNAYNYLQDALDATSGAGAYEIWVAEGTYYPDDGDSVTANDRSETFQLISGVEIYGGFDHGDAWEDRDVATNVTILSGDIGTASVNTDNSYHVVTGSGTNSTSILDGFTITDGFAYTYPGGPDQTGAGVNISSGSPTLKNCTITLNTAHRFGGGMYNENSNPTIIDCTFSQNIITHPSGQGGGLYNTNSDPTITNCTFTENSAYEGESGGAIHNRDGSVPVITGCTFTDNDSHEHGGAIYNFGSSPVFTDCTFTGNDTAGEGGGAVANRGASSPTFNRCIFAENTAYEDGGAVDNDSVLTGDCEPIFTNCVFVENSADWHGGAVQNNGAYVDATYINCTFSVNHADHDGGGMYNTGSATATIINCIFWNNTADGSDDEIGNSGTITVTYSDVKGGYTGTGNVDVDPQFEADNYHLSQPGVATVVNGGTVADYGDKDIDHEDRVMKGVVDMGADEICWPCTGLQQKGDADGDGEVEFHTSGGPTDDYNKWYTSYTTSTYNTCCDFDRDGDVDLADFTIGTTYNCETGATCPNCQGVW